MTPPLRWTAAGLALAAGLLLGCPTGEPAAAPKTKLRVVTWAATHPAVWNEVLRLFHERHPDIQVEREAGPNSSTQLHDLLTQRLREKDATIDVFLMDVVWPAEFAAAGWALPLDDRFDPAARAEFFESALDAVTVDGKVYGVPLLTDAGLLYYRKDLLEEHGLEPPRTWAELVRQAQTVLAAEDDPRLYGYSAQLKQYEGLVCNLLEVVGSRGGALEAPEAAPTQEALRFVRDELVAKIAPPGVLTYQEQEALDLFKSGGAVFHRNWPFAWAVCADPEASSVAGRVGVTSLPAFEGGDPAPCLGGWSFGIHSRSRHPEEAWRFVEFMTSAEVQGLFAVQAGKAPARRALYEDPQVLAANPHFGALQVALERAAVRPSSPAYAEISRILQRFLHRAISDPEADLAALAAEVRGELAAAGGPAQD